jgi:excisionase family DNA binding protein
MSDIQKKYLTQKEVADLFRVSQSTIKAWRDAGLLEYLQPPGSSRVLYPREAIEAFERNYTRRAKRFEVAHSIEPKSEKAVTPSKSKKIWKI